MFESLKFGKKKACPIESHDAPMIGLWSECSGAYYISAFRKQLDEIADKLSREGKYEVYTHFNSSRKCAELYTRQDGIIARVEVRGEMWLAQNVLVTSDLSEASRVFFALLITGHVEHKNFPC